jgi:hypothetical protein
MLNFSISAYHIPDVYDLIWKKMKLGTGCYRDLTLLLKGWHQPAPENLSIYKAQQLLCYSRPLQFLFIYFFSMTKCFPKFTVHTFCWVHPKLHELLIFLNPKWINLGTNIHFLTDWNPNINHTNGHSYPWLAQSTLHYSKICFSISSHL